MVVMAVFLDADGCAGLALLLADWCQDASCTGNLPRERRDITETLLRNPSVTLFWHMKYISDREQCYLQGRSFAIINV